MTKNKHFNRALYVIKHGAIGAISGAILMGGVIIPAGGLVAHGVKHMGDDKYLTFAVGKGGLANKTLELFEKITKNIPAIFRI